MKRKIVVIDSSVAIKWINRQNELLIEQANKILQEVQFEKTEIAAPELSKYEIGNAMLRKKITLLEAKVALEKLYDIPIRFISLDLELATRSLEIASENKITYYDASFLALAEKLKAVLVTDNPKHQKIPGKKIKVVALKDY